MGENEELAGTWADTGSERRQLSRRRILKAARALFTERGYHETRPQDISRAAGVGHGTFYLHFEDKRACFLAFADEAAAEIDEIVTANLAGATSVAQMVRAVLDGIAEYAQTNPGVIKSALVDADIIDRSTIRISPHLVDRWAKRWAELLSELRESRSIAADLNTEVVGYALVGLLHQSTTAHERGHYSRDELLRTVVPFIERALEPRK